MLTSHLQNTHHSILPPLGAIVVTPDLPQGRRPIKRGIRWQLRKFIVVSFPLSDAADQRYERGIHTCNIKALDNGEVLRVSGHWCIESD